MNLFSLGFMVYAPFFPSSLCDCNDLSFRLLQCHVLRPPPADTHPTLSSPWAGQEQGEPYLALRYLLARHPPGQREQVTPGIMLQLQIPDLNLYLLLRLKIFFSMIAAEFVCHRPIRLKSLPENWQTETQTFISFRTKIKIQTLPNQSGDNLLLPRSEPCSD